MEISLGVIDPIMILILVIHPDVNIEKFHVTDSGCQFGVITQHVY